MFGWPRGALAGQPRRGRLAERRRLRRDRRARRPAAGARRAGRVRAHDAAPRRQHASCAACWRARSTRRGPAHGGTIWIAEDVTERRRSSRRWPRARDAAEAASRAKSAFLANTSHEIRTPLNGLLGLARLARQPDVDRGPARAVPRADRRQRARRSPAIISDILDLSKIEAGKLHARDTRLRPARAARQRCSRGYGRWPTRTGWRSTLRRRRPGCRGACAATRCGCARSSATS